MSKNYKKLIENNYRFDKKLSNFYCDSCDYWTQSEPYIRQHITSHSSDRQFICHINDCQMSYKRSSHLLRHQRIRHLGQKPFECDICEKRMNSSVTLKEHISNIHLKTKPYVCRINGCGKRFGYFSSFERHQKSFYFLKHRINYYNKLNNYSLNAQKVDENRKQFEFDLRNHKFSEQILIEWQTIVPFYKT